VNILIIFRFKKVMDWFLQKWTRKGWYPFLEMPSSSTDHGNDNFFKIKDSITDELFQASANNLFIRNIQVITLAFHSAGRFYL
jgi:hypothetical protein